MLSKIVCDLFSRWIYNCTYSKHPLDSHRQTFASISRATCQEQCQFYFWVLGFSTEAQKWCKRSKHDFTTTETFPSLSFHWHLNFIFIELSYAARSLPSITITTNRSTHVVRCNWGCFCFSVPFTCQSGEIIIWHIFYNRTKRHKSIMNGWIKSLIRSINIHLFKTYSIDIFVSPSLSHSAHLSPVRLVCANGIFFDSM